MAVLLRVVSMDFGGINFEGEYLESGNLEYESVQVYVAMLRNFTHLDINVSLVIAFQKPRITFFVISYLGTCIIQMEAL